MTPEQRAAIAQFVVPNPCPRHPWSVALTVSRFDDRTPLCALCWDAELAGMSIQRYERHLRQERP